MDASGDTALAEKRACVGIAQISLKEGAKIGFVIYVHFEARISANEYLRASLFRLSEMLGETSVSEMRGEETRI